MRVLHPHAKLLFSQVVAYVGRMPASCPLLPLREEACHRRIWAGGGEPPLPSAPTTAVPAVRSRQEEARRCWIRAGGGKSPSRKPPPSAPTAAAPTAEPPTALATVARYGQEEACRPTSTTAVASLSSAVAASGGGVDGAGRLLVVVVIIVNKEGDGGDAAARLSPPTRREREIEERRGSEEWRRGLKYLDRRWVKKLKWMGKKKNEIFLHAVPQEVRMQKWSYFRMQLLKLSIYENRFLHAGILRCRMRK